MTAAEKIALTTTATKSTASTDAAVAAKLAAVQKTYAPAYTQQATLNNNLNTVVQDAYWRALGRSPDASGIATYTAALRSGQIKDINQLLATLYSSEEYKGLGPQGVFDRQWGAGGEKNARAAATAEWSPYYNEQRQQKRTAYQGENLNARRNDQANASTLYDQMAQRGLVGSPYGYTDTVNASNTSQKNYENATNLFNQYLTQLTRDEQYQIEDAILKRKGEASQRYYGDMANQESNFETAGLGPILKRYGY